MQAGSCCHAVTQRLKCLVTNQMGVVGSNPATYWGFVFSFPFQLSFILTRCPQSSSSRKFLKVKKCIHGLGLISSKRLQIQGEQSYRMSWNMHAQWSTQQKLEQNYLMEFWREFLHNDAAQSQLSWQLRDQSGRKLNCFLEHPSREKKTGFSLKI